MRANKILFSIIAVAVVVRLVLWCFQKDPALSDGWRYMKEGVNLVQHATFSSKIIDPLASEVKPTAWDMPLYACIVAGAYKVTDSIPNTQRLLGLINIALVVGSALFFLATLKYAPFRYSLKQKATALIVLLFMPEMVIYSLFHMTEQLAIFFLCAVMWGYVRGISSDQKGFYWATLFLIGGVYTKPIFLPFGCSLIVAIPFVAKGNVLCRIVRSFVLLLVLMLSLFPWYCRNRISIGTGGLASVIGSNPYAYNLKGFAEDTGNVSLLQEMNRLDEKVNMLDEMARSNIQGEFARNTLLKNFGPYVKFAMKGCIRLFLSLSDTAYYDYLGMTSVKDAALALRGVMEYQRHEVNRDNYQLPVVTHKVQFDAKDVLLAKWLRCANLLFTFVGYVVVFLGFVGVIKGLIKDPTYQTCMIFFCVLASALLLIAISGPAIGYSRYRTLIMPLLAILCGENPVVCFRTNMKNIK